MRFPFGGKIALQNPMQSPPRTPQPRALAKDAVVAVSLANLQFLDAWRGTLNPESYFYCYTCETFEGWIDLASLLADVALLGLAFFAAIRFVRRARSPRFVAVAEVALIVLALIPLNAAREHIPPLSSRQISQSLGWASFAALVGALGLVSWVVLARRKQAARAVVAILLILSPFGIVAVAQGVWVVRSVERDFVVKKAECSERAEAGRRPRVVWMIFDEMDYEVAFAERPDGLRLPEFDRLRDESLAASGAYPPAGFTELAIPSLLTGARVTSTEVLGPSDLRMQIADRSDTITLADTPTIFTRARDRGLATGAVGWFHPYCRLFGPDLCSCYAATKVLRGPQETNLLEAMIDHALVAADTVPVLGRFVPRHADAVDDFRVSKLSRVKLGHSRALYETLAPRAVRLAADPSVDMVFLHLSVPHPPGIYDRATQTFDVDGKGGYLDNLALADRTLGELRRAMEESGVWEGTNVLVTSDHFLRVNLWMSRRVRGPGDRELWARRKEDFRVPFLLKLAGPTGSLAYDAPFNTVLSHDLTVALMDGAITSYPDLARWLDEHKTYGPVEYNSPPRTTLTPVRRPRAEGE
jgi:hypothetical protein